MPDVQIQPDTREVLVDGAPVTMGARAFDVLAHLHANQDRVVSKAELLETVWGGLAVEEGNLTVQISTLRKALGPKAIATVPGVGYKLAIGAASATPRGPALPDKPSLVVLPFANLSGTAENDYLVDGLITDIIASLSRLSALYVIAASTSFRFKGQPVDIADVGRQLGVRYAVEGSVQQAGASLRVTVQLVEAETGRTIWSERFTGETQNVFDLQDEIAARVAGAVEPKLMFAEAGLSQGKPTGDLGAYDLVLRALPHVYRVQTLEDFRKGVDLLDRAIERDPGYRMAKAWKVRAYLIARGARMISWEENLEAAPLAKTLLAEAGDDPLVLVFAGQFFAFSGWGQEEGAEAVRRARRLCPNSALVNLSAGWPLSYIGAYDEAIEAFEKGMRLDPLGDMVVYCRMGASLCHLHSGRIETAVALSEQVVAELPSYGTGVQTLVLAYWAAGRVDDARRTAEALRRIVPDVTLTATLESSPYRRPEQRQMMIDAFRGAGLPD
ncbi:winged helix-turn-helix domain-containing protein [Roseibacterium sp. SDUM158016]|uniref:winged helix-turn-helix domain-containing protein n=1 Tax=Roseicyclus sediminis TaxID=2980997 RepID=UPI0021CE51B9|nr:winged helix-turn-helix domain-containing protein [Roseibacterium sp. SDUM158016]MCU4654466.1 winged helix-turn-helix domain-containing protein [Roseibacterium sp. SDUM158016]